MNIQTLKKKLSQLNEQITSILKDSGYNKTLDLSETEWNMQNPDDCMLYYKFLEVLYHLDYTSQTLSYLEKPVTKEGIIEYRGNRYELDGMKLQEGQSVEILVEDEYLKNQIWKKYYVEYTDHFYNRIRAGARGRLRKP